MAKPIPKLNSVELDNIRVEYDKEKDTIRIIAQDKDLSAPFALGVQKGGKLEKDLKDLLASKGITKQIAPAKINIYGASTSNLVIQPHGKIPLFSHEKKGQVITVTSARSGVGKSTAAVMFGGALARTPEFTQLEDPYKICIVDFDVANGSLGHIVKSDKQGSLGIYENGKIDASTILRHTYYDSSLGVYVIPISLKDNIEAINYLGEKFFEKLLKELKEIFHLVIIDTASNDLAHTNNLAYENSDVIILASNFDRSTHYSVNTWLKTFHNKTLLNKITVLLSSTPKLQAEANMKELRGLFNPLSIVGNIPMDSVSILTSLRNRNLGGLFETNNKVAEAYEIVASRMLQN